MSDVSLSKLKGYLNDKIARRGFLQEIVEKSSQEKMEKEERKEHLTIARHVVSEASRKTQLGVKERLEAIVTEAIREIYYPTYKFNVDFEIKANKSQCLLTVQDLDREPFHPKDQKGGGLLDVISLNLRMAMRMMEKPSTRNVLILDEPGKWTGALLSKFAELMKEMSEKLGTQIIMVTHDPELRDVADRSWRVVYDGKVSTLRSSEGEELKQRKEEDPEERKVVRRRSN